MEKTQAKPRIRVGRTEMDFAHQGKILTAVHPFYGPANSKTLQNLIRKDEYIEPTSAQLTSFVHEYFNSDEPQAKEVTQIMKDTYFRGFTGILYIPKEKIAHFIDYLEFDINSRVNKNGLLKRLDENHAQVPFKHLEEDSVNWRKIAKHPYLVAWAGGKEGAEKLAELASKHPDEEVRIRIPNISDLKEPTVRVAALLSNVGGLDVSSNSWSGGDYSWAFGVLKDTEATVAKK